MSRRIAFLTLDERGDFVIADDLALEPLARLGWQPEVVSWRQPATPWSAFDAVIIRSTWDYWDDVNGFLRCGFPCRGAQGLMVPLLLGGDAWLERKPVRLRGPSLSKLKITVHILDDSNGSIQKYVSMRLATNLPVAGASLAIATVVGTFVTTWMIGRIAHLNAAAVFISLLFWGWLWGVWGMLLSIPIIVIAKVVSQHVDELHPMAELLGD